MHGMTNGRYKKNQHLIIRINVQIVVMIIFMIIISVKMVKIGADGAMDVVSELFYRMNLRIGKCKSTLIDINQ